MFKLDVTYEAAEELFLQMIYHGYSNCYSCYKEDYERYQRDPVRYQYKKEDLLSYESTLQAYERLADHCSYNNKGKNNLQRIRDGIDYKYRITKGMSDGKVR